MADRYAGIFLPITLLAAGMPRRSAAIRRALAVVVVATVPDDLRRRSRSPPACPVRRATA
jgi:hypothetical protein